MNIPENAWNSERCFRASTSRTNVRYLRLLVCQLSWRTEKLLCENYTTTTKIHSNIEWNNCDRLYGCCHLDPDMDGGRAARVECMRVPSAFSIAEAGIRSIEDAAGKKVGAGASGMTQHPAWSTRHAARNTPFDLVSGFWVFCSDLHHIIDTQFGSKSLEKSPSLDWIKCRE